MVRLGGLVFCVVLANRTPAVQAQTPAEPGQQSTAAPVQAPDELLRRVADLVHAGKFADAQQTVNGLLVLYPEDARLLKAKSLLEKAPAAPAVAQTAPTSAPAATEIAGSPQPATPATISSAPALSGMDRVDYNALLELARQAQQTTDVAEQRSLSNRFLKQSSSFVEKHPDDVLIWQLRAATARAANAPLDGFEAGQKLVALGAADRGDVGALRLLGQLKNLGWMDKQQVTVANIKAQTANQFAWMLGNWNLANPYNTNTHVVEVIQPTNESFEMWSVKDGARQIQELRGKILATGEIAWEWDYYNPSGVKEWPTGWQPIVMKDIGGDNKTFTLIEPSSRKKPWTYFLRRPDAAESTAEAKAKRRK